jgi:hypothetical protein
MKLAALSRRAFLGEVGKGMLVATVGSAVAAEMALAKPEDGAGEERLTFGSMERLVGLMQETPVERLNSVLVAELSRGVDLRTLTAAGALANARTFGGEDYVGFHTLMALSPAYRMSQEISGKGAALPVLKVLYRNTSRIRERGVSPEVLHPVAGAEKSGDGEALRAAVRGKDMTKAERVFASIAGRGADEAFNALLIAVQDNTEVHRVVLPYRAWDLLDVVGKEQAHTLLRQSVRYCVKAESWAHSQTWDKPRQVLPAMFDEFKLMGKTPGDRKADDAFVEKLSMAIFSGTPDEAARAAAGALAEGFAPDVVGEAVSLAANQLILRDMGRRPNEEVTGKPIGSVHGDSIGVHACDSANAWRNMARVANARNTFACLILGAFQAAFDRVNRGGDFVNWQPLPVKYHLDGVKSQDAAVLLKEAEDAVRGNLQARAAAVVHRYGELGYPERPVFDLMLKYAVSEDGSLHGEKYYRTTSEEFARTRPAFRWRQLVALARVTASEYGRAAAGVGEARGMLGV